MGRLSHFGQSATIDATKDQRTDIADACEIVLRLLDIRGGQILTVE